MSESVPLILIADDEIDTLELVRLYLANEGYRFLQALDGGEALRLAQEQMPDLILLDLNMPVMDGYAVLEQLRHDSATASMVVVIMTAAYSRRQDRLKGFALGADDYILKPLDRRELAARIRSRLRVKQLEHDLRQQQGELESLYRVAQEVATTLKPPELAKKLLSVAGETIGAEDGWIILVNENREPLHAFRFGESLSPADARVLARQSLREGIGGEVSRTQTGVLIADSTVDKRYSTGELGLEGVRSLVSVPLLGRRRYRGVLTYAHSSPGRFAKQHLHWLRTVAGQAAVALDNAYLFAREQRRAVQSRLLNSITQDMSAILEPERLPEVVVNLLQRSFGYYYVGLALAAEEQGLVVMAAARDDPEVGGLPIGQPARGGAVAWVAENGRPLLISDVRVDPRYVDEPDVPGTRSELALPIHVQGEIGGVLDVRSRQAYAFDADDVLLLETFATQLSTALQNASRFREQASHHEQLSAILNSVSDVVLVSEGGDQLLLANDAAKTLFQLGGTEGPIMIQQLPADLRPFLTEPIPPEGRIESEYVTEDLRRFRVAVTPFIVGGGGGRVVMLRDASGAESLDRLKDDFIASISAEVQDPLNRIAVACERLAEPELTAEDQRISARQAHQAAKLASRLVAQLLDISTLSSGLGVKPEHMDAAELLESIAQVLEQEAKLMGLDFTLDVEAPLPIFGDPARVGQAIRQLVTNAIHGTPIGGRVILSAKVQDDEVLFEVEDTGTGISAEDQPFVFDRFFRGRAPGAESKEGVGLGLSIAKLIVDRHRGRIWFESEVGEGSRFYITLPLVQPA